MALIIHDKSYTSSGLVCATVCGSIWTHLSVTAGGNWLIWGMIMGYDVGFMPVVSKFWYCLVSQMHRQKLLSPKGSHVINIKTAANIHRTPLPIFTQYRGMQAHCKHRLEWLACWSIFLMTLTTQQYIAVVNMVYFLSTCTCFLL